MTARGTEDVVDQATWDARRKQLEERMQGELRKAVVRQITHGGRATVTLLDSELASHAVRLTRLPARRTDGGSCREEILHTLSCLDTTFPDVQEELDGLFAVDESEERYLRSQIASDIWYAAGRAYAHSPRLTVVNVAEALQYQMLATEPPDVVHAEEIVLPCECFALEVPARACEHIGYTSPYTHVLVCAAPWYAGVPESTVNFLVITPWQVSGDTGDSLGHRLSAGIVYGSVLPGLRSRDSLLRNYILNVLIYLGAEGTTLRPRHADEIAKIEAIPKKKRRKVLDERLARLKQDTTFELSTTLPIDPFLKDFVLEGGLKAPAYTLKGRTLVRGHWRNQACGEGRKDRKRIQIAPHFKGPALSEQLAATVHTYNLRAPKERTK